MKEGMKEETLKMNIEAIGIVRNKAEGEAVLEIVPGFKEGLDGVSENGHIQILYWMHRLRERDRKTLRVRPRYDKSRPLQGVFSLRSTMRPNPIGVSVAQVRRIEGNRLYVKGLDALDGSPIIDIKAAPR